MNRQHLFAVCFLTATASLALEGYLNEEIVPITTTGTLKDGKVEVRITRRILWTSKPTYPVTVALQNEKRAPILTRTITKGVTAELSGFVAPGKYTIYSEMNEASSYWSSFGGTVTVGADGGISIQPQPIEHKLKMTLLAPDQMAIVQVARPTLKWKPMTGAASYTVRWFEKDPKTNAVLSEKQNIEVTSAEWTFPFDLVAARTYEWQVDAYDKEGSRFAYFSSGYFRTK